MIERYLHRYSSIASQNIQQLRNISIIHPSTLILFSIFSHDSHPYSFSPFYHNFQNTSRITLQSIQRAFPWIETPEAMHLDVYIVLASSATIFARDSSPNGSFDFIVYTYIFHPLLVNAPFTSLSRIRENVSHPLNDWYSMGRRVLRILSVLVPSSTDKYPEKGLPVTDGIRYPRGVEKKKKENDWKTETVLPLSSFLTYSASVHHLEILIENSSARGGPHEYQLVFARIRIQTWSDYPPTVFHFPKTLRNLLSSSGFD